MIVVITRSTDYTKARMIAMGTNVPATIEVDIDPAQLDAAARSIIIEMAGHYPDRLDGLRHDPAYKLSRYATANTPLRMDAEADAISADTVSRLIRDAMGFIEAKRAEKETKERAAVEKQQRQREEEIARLQPVIDAFLNDDNLLPERRPETHGRIWGDAVYLHGGTVPSWHPQHAALFAEAVRRLDERDRRHAEEERAAEQRRTDQLTAWIRDHGTEGQRKRLSRSLLPESEILDALREHAFAPLADLRRYERITAAEVRRSYEQHMAIDCYDAEVQFAAEAAESATDEQLALIERIESLMPDASVELRDHLGFLAETSHAADAAAQIVRQSIKVILTVGVISLSREYAA